MVKDLAKLRDRASNTVVREYLVLELNGEPMTEEAQCVLDRFIANASAKGLNIRITDSRIKKDAVDLQV